MHRVRDKISPRSPGVESLCHRREQGGGDVEFVMFEDVHGHEVYVNPSRVIWVRELGDNRTVISCGRDDTFTVRLSPAQAVAVLGVKVR